MNKVSIEITPAFRDILASSILNLAREHRHNGCGIDCPITLFPIRELIEQLLERPLTKDERDILS